MVWCVQVKLPHVRNSTFDEHWISTSLLRGHINLITRHDLHESLRHLVFHIQEYMLVDNPERAHLKSSLGLFKAFLEIVLIIGQDI